MHTFRTYYTKRILKYHRICSPPTASLQIIIRQGEELEDMYFVVKGTVKMIRELRKDFHLSHWNVRATLPGAAAELPPLYPWAA